MTETFTLITVAGTFLLAGSVKGIIGLGLPIVSLGVLAIVLDLTTAMALMLIPAFVSNIWQAAVGGKGKIIFQRIWPFLLMATATIWLGAKALTSVNPLFFSMLLGVLLAAYSSFNLIGFSLSISPQNEKWVGPVFGMANGILTGMTGSSVVPGVMFLQAIGLPRDMLVQAMGMLFCLSTIALAFALQQNSLLTNELKTISALAVVPAIMGMIIGQRVRKSLSESRFRKTFFVSIFLLGVFNITKSVFSLN